MKIEKDSITISKTIEETNEEDAIKLAIDKLLTSRYTNRRYYPCWLCCEHRSRSV